MARTRKTATKATRKTDGRATAKTSASQRRKPTATAEEPDDLSHDVLHGPVKPLIYAAMSKRLHTIR